jgi:hypothetical protein
MTSFPAVLGGRSSTLEIVNGQMSILFYYSVGKRCQPSPAIRTRAFASKPAWCIFGEGKLALPSSESYSHLL